MVMLHSFVFAKIRKNSVGFEINLSIRKRILRYYLSPLFDFQNEWITFAVKLILLISHYCQKRLTRLGSISGILRFGHRIIDRQPCVWKWLIRRKNMKFDSAVSVNFHLSVWIGDYKCKIEQKWKSLAPKRAPAADYFTVIRVLGNSADVLETALNDTVWERKFFVPNFRCRTSTRNEYIRKTKQI